MLESVAIYFPDKGANSIPLPSIQKIFHELMFSLLKSQEYALCLSFCNHVLQCTPGSKPLLTLSQGSLWGDNSLLPTSQGCLPSSGVSEASGSRKRLRSVDSANSQTVLSQDSMVDLDLYACVYKADSLIYLGQIEEAVKMIDR